ncbi:MAG: hypothetical protein K0R72_339 [Clostridia bacterium]|jgi:uncharacterized protein (TIGR02328 family)|nr:hypothetical protein [Clostridia bacterium]
MRLWSKELIKYLPNKQLLSQWREIIAIIGSIKKKGFPNHILVNKVMNYPLNHFSSYSKLVTDEMIKRGFNLNKQKIEYVYEFCGSPDILFNEIFSSWHNEEYIKICLYNIYEKYICGGITEEEWNRIIKKYEYLLK